MPKTEVAVSGGEHGELYVKDGDRFIAGMSTKDVKAVRKALNDWHRKKKAEKPRERYYARKSVDGTVWLVLARDSGGVARGSFPHSDMAEADAKAFAKLLNREDRKRNTVTPGFKEI